ncbi:MAG: peptidase T [Defluviitaleaceae bacterium]|nr:peptidase T [Defluviitaleaceae bacterium]
MESKVTERFLRYVRFDTQSSYDSKTYPSTPKQLDFAKTLRSECEFIGMECVRQDANGYVTAKLPASAGCEGLPAIGFFAHMDTSPDSPGGGVNPRIVEAYPGGEIKLGGSVSISPEDFPHLNNYVGQDLVVSDGTTLLGADDKAGVAEIITAMEFLIENPKIEHGEIMVAFTPDEEIGKGVDRFDIAAFGADYAYTVDGDEIGVLESETFNAARAVFEIKGKSVHPGYAYKTMINAGLIASELIQAFPKCEAPSKTKDREGFYHLTSFSGETGAAHVVYLLRDFDDEGIERRKRFAQDAAALLNNKYGAGAVTVSIKDEYGNMRALLAKQPEIIERARNAMLKAGVAPVDKPIRGGTDGARLTFMGLPCPNIFAGGHNFHGPYEYIPVPSMEAAVRVIVNICEAV